MSVVPTADLFVHVYVLVDDALAGGAVRVPRRPGPAPGCSDAEVLPGQSELNRRVRYLWGAFEHLLARVPVDAWQQIDTTALPVKHPSGRPGATFTGSVAREAPHSPAGQSASDTRRPPEQLEGVVRVVAGPTPDPSARLLRPRLPRRVGCHVGPMRRSDQPSSDRLVARLFVRLTSVVFPRLTSRGLARASRLPLAKDVRKRSTDLAAARLFQKKRPTRAGDGCTGGGGVRRQHRLADRREQSCRRWSGR